MAKYYIELRELFLSFDPNQNKQEKIKTDEIEYTEFTEVDEDEYPLGIQDELQLIQTQPPQKCGGFCGTNQNQMMNSKKEWNWMDYWTTSTTATEITWTQTSTDLTETNKE